MLSCAPLLLGGCASRAYAGIPLAPGAADPELQSLARRAQAGAKQAQLELGIRYEEGRGLPADPARARRLYAAASADGGGTRFIYSPPVGRHGRGQVIPLDAGPRQPGLREARERLAALGAAAAPPGQQGSAPVAAGGNRETWRAVFDRFVSAARDRSPAEARSALWSALEPGGAGPPPADPHKVIETADGTIDVAIALAPCPFAPAWAQESCRARGEYLEAKMTFAGSASRDPACFANEDLLRALVAGGWALPQAAARPVPIEGGVPVITYDSGMGLDAVLSSGPRLFAAIRPSADDLRTCYFTLTMFVF